MGDQAPDFETTTDTGEKFILSRLKDKRILLHFYPKDDASGFSSIMRIFKFVEYQYGVSVYGVSSGSSKSHQDFKTKHNLRLPLLMDQDFRIAELYGACKMRQIYGKEYMGIERTSILINQEGKVEAIFGGTEGTVKADAKEHAKQVFAFWGLKL